jgi:cytochrome c-type biogenesis protein
VSVGTASVAFAAGVLSVLNPCGIALLPPWVAQLSGRRSGGDLLERTFSGLAAGLAVSAGFALLFVPLGLVSSLAVNRATAALPWLGAGLGLILVFVGLWLASGRSLELGFVRTRRAAGRGGLLGLGAYGAAYATVALGCTFPTFLLAVGIQGGESTDAVGVGVAAFTIGATLVLSTITIAVIVAATTPRLGGFAKELSALTPLLLVVAGAYMAGREARLALADSGVSVSPQVVPAAVLIAGAALLAVWAAGQLKARRVSSVQSQLHQLDGPAPRTEDPMPEELPIACSLDARDMTERYAEMSALGRSSLIETEQGVRHAVLRFRDGNENAVRLAEIVAAEAECCAFLSMDVREEREGLQLTIEAPEGAELILEDMVKAFRGEAELVR